MHNAIEFVSGLRLGLPAMGALLTATSVLYAGVLGVSPGEAERSVRVQTPCPTFSWTSAAGTGYEIEIYRVDDGGPDIGEPLLRQALPAGATSWTPAEDDCLNAGHRYAWSVRAISGEDGKDEAGPWSEALVFEVPESAVTLEQVRAMQQELEQLRSGRTPRVVTLAQNRPNKRLGELAGQAAAVATPAASQAVNASDWVAPSTTEGAPPPGAAGLSVESGDASGTAAEFISNVGGRLISGQALGDEVFSVDAAGNVEATSYTGDGSGLLGVLSAGQACPIGWIVNGLDAQGSVFCVPASTLISRVEPLPSFILADPAIAMGLDGNPVISYHDLNADALRVAKCNDPACSGGDETITTVEDPPGIGVGGTSSIAISFDGNPVISYFGNNGSLRVAKCNDPACTGMNETITQVVASPVVSVSPHTSIAIGNDGRPVISFTGNSGVLFVVKCNDSACTGAGETITAVDDPANSVGQYNSIAIGHDGNPVISYYDLDAMALKVAKCNDSFCAGMNETITFVDDPGNDVGKFTSIAVGDDGYPVISYFDETSDGLKVAKCNDPACAGQNETLTVVDSAGSVGRYTSLAVGVDGNPVISYHDFTEAALKVARCNDPACADLDETITSVDDSADLPALDTSIVIGLDGYPVIASYANTGFLKVAKCANPSCTP